MSLRIRAGTAGDARAIASVHHESREAAYRGMISEEILNGLEESDRIRRWRAWLEDPECLTLLGEVDGVLVGFCTIGPSRDEDLDASRVAEMPTLYVGPAWWRRGHGRALCEEACRRARARGFETLTLWVMDPNERAQAFYEAFGFEHDGASKLDDGPIPSTLTARRYRMTLS